MAHQARQDQKERTIQVNTKDLLEALKSNRDKHVQEYKEALRGYKETALAELEQSYAKAQKKLDSNFKKTKVDIDEFDQNDLSEISDYIELIPAFTVRLQVPRNFKKEYDAAIDMVNWDVRDVLELTHAEFQCFVRDEWEWTNSFKAVSMIYGMAK